MAIRVFVDGSSCPTTKTGFGAALWLATEDERTLVDLKREVVVRRFYPCSSSSLELMALLWALEGRGVEVEGVVVFTDSQTIVGLAARREALEDSGYRSRGGGLLSQADLYRKFFDASDRLSFSVVKVAGHKRETEKMWEDRCFTLVDRASRLALRSELGRRKDWALTCLPLVVSAWNLKS